jgi:hypothetical protein
MVAAVAKLPSQLSSKEAIVSHEALQAVVGTALIDKEFRLAMLNGSRAAVIKQFDLSPDEREAIMSIEASTLEQFAWQLHNWIMEKRRAEEDRQAKAA